MKNGVSMTAGEFPTNVETKPCKACGALMPKAAYKCTKCDSYQNWHHKVGVSTSVLAMLTALISVSAVVVPGLWGWLRSGHAIIDVDFAHDDEEGGIFINATNSGDRAGTIAGVKVQFETRTKKFDYQAALDRDANPVIEAGKYQKVRFTLEVGQDLRSYKVSDVIGQCILMVAKRDRNGSATVPIRRDCRDIRPLDFAR